MKNFKQAAAEALDLPKDVVLNLPKITVIGETDVVVENFCGVLEYTADCIRLNLRQSILTVRGSGLDIRSITDEDVGITGRITAIEFIR